MIHIRKIEQRRNKEQADHERGQHQQGKFRILRLSFAGFKAGRFYFISQKINNRKQADIKFEMSIDLA